MRKKGQKNLTYTQRLILEDCLKAGLHKKIIAEKLGVRLSTVYNEIHRGEYSHTKLSYYDEFGDKHYKEVKRYSPEKAEETYRINQTSKGAPLKIGNDYDFVRYVEKRVCSDKLSPCAVLGEIKRKKLFRTDISKTTLYRYIDIGIFSNIKRTDLPLKRERKHYRKTVIKRPSKGTSIENRPEEIFNRDTFGHWEMDCVVGKKETKDVLLVLTERLTRYEIILKMKNRKAETVVSGLNKIERKFGNSFRKVFKTITVDNGVEFSDYMGLEKSIYRGKRVNVYYCHPYASCERGSNERINRDIRRLLPKGTDFSKVSDSRVKFVETWVNNYPREIFKFASAAEMFQKQLESI